MSKRLILTIAFSCFGLSLFAQNDSVWVASNFMGNTEWPKELSFDLRGRYTHPVKKEKLTNAKLLNDFVADYPTNWVANYISVEVKGTCDGKEMKAIGANNFLTAEQKKILNTIDLSSDLIITVKYKEKNPVNHTVYDNQMNIALTVVPEIEAQYLSGQDDIKKYLKDYVIKKITETVPQEFQKGIVTFTIDEAGEVTNAKISLTSGDAKTDKFLLNTISSMPKWKPAQNAKGEKVKQEFVFTFGVGGC